ncbi:VOC family protein [Photorhabdus temperata]|uniref:VOC family protein n=1 Tax=Photorhabdus temperata TaxID=574560 RepID=UPI0021D4D451|nr:VOC family protein [Photorhabdus temperata]MCT8348037.1 VOC family protein [Photorhabdus temperata]
MQYNNKLLHVELYNRLFLLSYIESSLHENDMMTLSPKPNLQLVYVSDIERSTAFYQTLFNSEPVFSSPRYVAFAADGEALFAIWSGGTKPDAAVPRFSEIGIMLPSHEDVDCLFEEWRKNPGIKIVQEPYTEVFGRTFLVEDPDGHIIRVCPLD